MRIDAARSRQRRVQRIAVHQARYQAPAQCLCRIERTAGQRRAIGRAADIMLVADLMICPPGTKPKLISGKPKRASRDAITMSDDSRMGIAPPRQYPCTALMMVCGMARN